MKLAAVGRGSGRAVLHHAPRRRAAASVLAGLALLVAGGLALFPAGAAEDNPFTQLFDTVATLARPVPSDTISSRSGWKLVPEDTVEHQFAGDAVLLNDKLAIILRKGGRGAEVYAKATDLFVHRASLGHARDASADLDRFDTCKIIENTSSAVMIAAGALCFRITTGEAILEIRSEDGAGLASVFSKASLVVVPDYFGDDMVFPANSPRGQYLPAENFCLHLLSESNAILMTVWPSSRQEIRLAPAGTGGEPGLACHQVSCLKGKSAWLAFLESPVLWQAGQPKAGDDWKPPFPAKWRRSLVRANGLADSWDLDHGPTPGQTNGPHEGPQVTYPMDRSTATPLTVSCPIDVMRNTLGVGPCQYILACEGLAAQGDPTPNSVMNWVEKQFEQKKQRKAADDIQERLKLMTEHIAQARGRIQQYSEFADRLRKLLADPAETSELRPIVDDLQRCLAAGLTPTVSPERAQGLADDVAALLAKEDALTACRSLGAQLRAIGEAQDSTLAKARMAVRRLRAQSKTILASRPPGTTPAREVQALAEELLQGKSALAGKGEAVPK